MSLRASFFFLLFFLFSSDVLKSQDGAWEEISLITNTFREKFNFVRAYDSSFVFFGTELGKLISYDDNVAEGTGSKYSYKFDGNTSLNYRDISVIKNPVTSVWTDVLDFKDIGFAIATNGNFSQIIKVSYHKAGSVGDNPIPVSSPFAERYDGSRLYIEPIDDIDHNGNGVTGTKEGYQSDDMFNSISFVKDNWRTGWIVGHNHKSDVGIIYKYTDGIVDLTDSTEDLDGTWSKVINNKKDDKNYPLAEILNEVALNDVMMVNDSLAFAVGENGVILKYNKQYNNENGPNWKTVRNPNYNDKGTNIDSTKLGFTFDLNACDFSVKTLDTNHYEVKGWLVGDSNILIIYNYTYNNGVITDSFVKEKVSDANEVKESYILRDVSTYDKGQVLVCGNENLLYKRDSADANGDTYKDGKGVWATPYTENTWTYNTHLTGVAYANLRTAYVSGLAGICAKINYFFYVFPEGGEKTNISGGGIVASDNMFLPKVSRTFTYDSSNHSMNELELFYNSNTSWNISNIQLLPDDNGKLKFFSPSTSIGSSLKNPFKEAPLKNIFSLRFYNRGDKNGGRDYTNATLINDTRDTINTITYVPDKDGNVFTVPIPNQNNLITNLSGQLDYAWWANIYVQVEGGVQKVDIKKKKSNFFASTSYVSYSGIPLSVEVTFNPKGTNKQKVYYTIPSVTEAISNIIYDTTITPIDTQKYDTTITPKQLSNANPIIPISAMKDAARYLYINSTINWEGDFIPFKNSNTNYSFAFIDLVGNKADTIKNFATDFDGEPISNIQEDTLSGYPDEGPKQNLLSIGTLSSSESRKVLKINPISSTNSFTQIVDTLKIRYYRVPYRKSIYNSEKTMDIYRSEPKALTDDTTTLLLSREIARLSFSSDTSIKAAPAYQEITIDAPAYQHESLDQVEKPEKYHNIIPIKIFSNTEWQPDSQYYKRLTPYSKLYHWEINSLDSISTTEKAPDSVALDTIIYIHVDTANYLANERIDTFKVFLFKNDSEYHHFFIRQFPSEFKTFTSQTQRKVIEKSSSDTLTFENAKGSIQTLYLEGNNFWTLDTSISKVSWLDYEGDTSFNHSTTRYLNFKTNDSINTSSDERLDSFVYYVARKTDTTFDTNFVKYILYLKQPALSFSTSTDTVYLSPKLGDTKSISISSNAPWYSTYESDIDKTWFSVDKSSGVKDGKIVFTSLQENITTPQYGNYTIYTKDSAITKTIVVKQARASVTNLSLANDTIFLDNFRSSTTSISLTVNSNWGIESIRNGIDSFYKTSIILDTANGNTTNYTIEFTAISDNVTKQYICDSIIIINAVNKMPILKKGLIVAQKGSYIHVATNSKTIDTNVLSTDITLSVQSNSNWIARLLNSTHGNIFDSLGYFNDNITISLNENYPNLNSRDVKVIFQILGYNANNQPIYGVTDTSTITQTPHNWPDNIIVSPTLSSENNHTILVRNINAKSLQSYATLLSLTGQVFDTKELINGSTEFYLNSLPTGIYLIRVFDGKYSTVKKILKD